ncbi:MAG: alpha/beta hydrolase [Bacteroidales bacterium]|nr:alpha/beta hydrolase [Bacteroidales bacterium]
MHRTTKTGGILKMRALLCLLCCSFLFFCVQCTAQEKTKPSAKSQLIYRTLNIANLNERIFEKLLNDPPRGKAAVSAKKLHASLQVKEQSIRGFNMLTITASPSARKHIFFLHGGAYVAEASSGHRKLIGILARDYGYRVTFIGYPLAPDHDILTSLEVLEEAYRLLVMQYKEDIFCLMGDSAGGGLALALLQRLRDNSVDTRPETTILFSPWLDASMTNPGIDTLIEKDVLLHKEGLITCGKLYAGGLEPDDPRLSPIYGNLNNLSDIKIFVSTHELFYPDCLLFVEKAAAVKNTHVDLTIKEQMVHDWVILPIAERDEVLKKVHKGVICPR